MDLHDRFNEWLATGAEGNPPRDAALHASSCDACLRATVALESLMAIDVGAVPLPSLPVSMTAPRRFPAMLRTALGAAAVLVVAVVVAVAASGLRRDAPAGAAPTPTVNEGVLAGEPSTAAPASTGHTPTPDPSASRSARPSRSVEAFADPTAAPPPPTVAPTTGGQLPTAPPPTVNPTAAPTAPPTSPPPAPTPTPSPTLIATPTATPTPVPTPTLLPTDVPDIP